MEHTDHHVGRLIDAIEDLGRLDDTLVYVIIGDNGASAEGTLHGAFNEMANFNGMARPRDARVHDLASSTSSAPRVLQPLRRRLGVGHGHARTSGPSRWRRTGAARATARSSTGRAASRTRAASATSSATSSTSPRRSSRRPGIPEPTMVNGVLQSPIEGTSMLYSFNDADAAGAPRPAVLRDVRQPRHLPQGLERRDQAPDAVGDGRRRRCPRSTTTSGSSTTAHGLDPGPRPRRKEMPDKLHELQRLWLIEATKYNVLPLDDRRLNGCNPDIAGRPTLMQGNTQLLFGGMGRLSENSVVNIKNKSFSVTAEVDVPGRRRRGRDHRPGRPVRRLEPVRQGRQGQVRLQRARHPGVHDRGRRADPGRQPPGAHGVRLRRRRARPRAATSRCTTTASRSATGGSTSTQPMSSLPTRRPTSGARPARRSAPTTRRRPASSTARSTGSRSTSATTTTTTSSIAEERLRMAMARQ